MNFEGLRFTVEHGGEQVQLTSPLVGKIQRLQHPGGVRRGAELRLGLEHHRPGHRRMPPRVPGRFESVEEGQPFLVVVDYAHTDDALRNVISVARELHPKRVITLFGCGGDRDRSKRPLMGRRPREASDFVVLTSDNPRSEDPIAIMNDALVGFAVSTRRTSSSRTARRPSAPRLRRPRPATS